MLVVLSRLGAAERIAFVLHDAFAVPFNEIAPVLGRHPDHHQEAGQPGPAAGPRPPRGGSG